MARLLACVVLFVTIIPLFGRGAIANPTAGPRSTVLLAPRPAPAEAVMLATIEQQGRARIDDLVRRLQSEPDPVARQAIARRIPDLKLDIDLQSLRFRAAWARGHGDPAAAQRFEDAVTMLLHPVIKARVSTETKAGAR